MGEVFAIQAHEQQGTNVKALEVQDRLDVEAERDALTVTTTSALSGASSPAFEPRKIVGDATFDLLRDLEAQRATWGTAQPMDTVDVYKQSLRWGESKPETQDPMEKLTKVTQELYTNLMVHNTFWASAKHIQTDLSHLVKGQ